MMRVLIGGAIVLGLLASGCVRYQEAGTETIGPEYSSGGGEWNSGGGITAVVRVFERDGATMVCGAWTTGWQSGMTQDLNEEVIARGSVYSGRTRLVHDLGFMPRLPYADNLSGEQARCVVSAKPWRPEFGTTEPRLRFPRYVSVDDVDAESGSGSLVVFRETFRPDLAR
jgi:hypothetical protein